MMPDEVPYDEDMNILPPKEKEDNGPYNFPSAVGYETVPEGWRPRSGRELPALRCTFVRDDGSRCKNFGIRGTGFGGMPAMCLTHGGALPPVKKKAESLLLSARMRLVQNADMAVDTLVSLMEPGTADNIRLKASTEVLDRAGIKGSADFSVDVNHTVSASDEIKKRLESIATRQSNDDEDIVDAEEITEEEQN